MRAHRQASANLDAHVQLESTVPSLCGAPCAILVDADEDAAFLDEAAEIAELRGPLSAAPIWTTPGPRHFLIVSANVAAPGLLWPRVEALELTNRAPR